MMGFNSFTHHYDHPWRWWMCISHQNSSIRTWYQSNLILCIYTYYNRSAITCTIEEWPESLIQKYNWRWTIQGIWWVLPWKMCTSDLEYFCFQLGPRSWRSSLTNNPLKNPKRSPLWLLRKIIPWRINWRMSFTTPWLNTPLSLT